MLEWAFTSLHHLQQLRIGESVLAPDDGHGLGAGLAVTLASRRSHPGGKSKGGGVGGSQGSY